MTGGFFCLVVQILTLGIDATGRFLIRAQVGIVSKSFLGEFNEDLPPKVNSHSCSWIVFGLHLTNGNASCFMQDSFSSQRGASLPECI